MYIKTIQTQPYLDQSFGTSGIRKKVSVVAQPHYIENLIQAVFNSCSNCAGETLVIGGDGRYFNDRAIQIILKIAIAHHFKRIIVGQNGILSTPATSHVIVKYRAIGGFILSASHNPGGPDGDFGLKFDNEHGAPSPKSTTDKIMEFAHHISQFMIADIPDIDLSAIGTTTIGDSDIQIISSTDDYVSYMAEIFDFEKLKRLFQDGFTIHYDAMNAVTGPYAVEIFEKILGAKAGSVVHANPLPDFGGLHPEPNLANATDLVAFMSSDGATDIGVASDGDGDRYMIMGPNFFVNPSDSLAVLTGYLDTIPYYHGKMCGVARSLPTSFAVDDVAKEKGISLYQTPTGWKFFGSLLTAGKISVCGEESFGAGSSHLQEKDGIWAILCWLSVMAETGKTVKQLVMDLWQKYGRVYAQLYDFSGLDKTIANDMMSAIKSNLSNLIGRVMPAGTITDATSFTYTDPITSEVADNQGICIYLGADRRIVFRLSGTSSVGATFKIYLNQRVKDEKLFLSDVWDTLTDLRESAFEISELKRLTGHKNPTMIT